MSDPDFTARANRAAAQAIAELSVSLPVDSLELLTCLVAIGWLKGYHDGSTDTVAKAQEELTRLADHLAAAIPA